MSVYQYAEARSLYEYAKEILPEEEYEKIQNEFGRMFKAVFLAAGVFILVVLFTLIKLIGVYDSVNDARLGHIEDNRVIRYVDGVNRYIDAEEYGIHEEYGDVYVVLDDNGSISNIVLQSEIYALQDRYATILIVALILFVIAEIASAFILRAKSPNWRNFVQKVRSGYYEEVTESD